MQTVGAGVGVTGVVCGDAVVVQVDAQTAVAYNFVAQQRGARAADHRNAGTYVLAHFIATQSVVAAIDVDARIGSAAHQVASDDVARGVQRNC